MIVVLRGTKGRCLRRGEQVEKGIGLLCSCTLVSRGDG